MTHAHSPPLDQHALRARASAKINLQRMRANAVRRQAARDAARLHDAGIGLLTVVGAIILFTLA
jgi:hypothetical protein